MITSSAPLGELVEIRGGGTPSKARAEFYRNGSVPWVTPKDMKKWDIDSSIDRITEQALENSTAKLIPPNSVLVVIRSGVLKHSLPVGISRVPLAVNQDLKALICGREVYPQYLGRFLRARAPVILRSVRGTTADNISTAVLKQLEIPLPPLAEQKRIAGILDAADALRAKRRESLAQLDTLIQATFLDMFGDPVTNPKGWDVVPFESLGKSRLGKMLDAAKQTDEDRCPYLANLNVQWNRFVLDDLREMTFTKADRAEFALEHGDLLICEGGEVGRTAIWRGEMENVFFQKALHRVRLEPDLAVPEFVLWFMWFMAEHGGFSDFTTSATIAHLTGVKLKRLPVPLPPVRLQRQFASIFESIDEHREQQTEYRSDLDALFSSLQARAFAGEL